MRLESTSSPHFQSFLTLPIKAAQGKKKNKKCHIIQIKTHSNIPMTLAKQIVHERTDLHAHALLRLCH